MELGDRYAAVDVHYPVGGGAHAAAVVGADPTFSELIEEVTAQLDVVDEYQPGQFYLRELPAIVAVLASTAPVELLVIDGYVDLDPTGRPGLGAHLHERIGIPVIGVAKTAFRGATHAAAVYRGRTASRPVYVTAAGMPVSQAAELVARMSGQYRIPDALRRADALSRAGQRSAVDGSCR